MTAICKEDIVSGKGDQYAPKGAEIQVFNQIHDTVFLCEYNGNKFPCSPKKLLYNEQ